MYRNRNNDNNSTLSGKFKLITLIDQLVVTVFHFPFYNKI
jgi:hypothetical protein